jgi:ferrous iron transport protein B
VFAIPANEIIIPTILMLTLNLAKSGLAQSGVMIELDEATTRDVLVGQGGWTLLTGVNLMLFSLLHNPCSTTLLTIYRETKSLKWTLWSALMPIGIGFAVCGLVAVVWRLVS